MTDTSILFVAVTRSASSQYSKNIQVFSTTPFVETPVTIYNLISLSLSLCSSHSLRNCSTLKSIHKIPSPALFHVPGLEFGNVCFFPAARRVERNLLSIRTSPLFRVSTGTHHRGTLMTELNSFESSQRLVFLATCKRNEMHENRCAKVKLEQQDENGNEW